MRRRSRISGQTVAEYMLVISVIVIALAAVVWTPMNSAIADGTKGFRENMESAGKDGYAGTSASGKRR